MLCLGENKHDFMRLLVNSCPWSPAVIRRMWGMQCSLAERWPQPALPGEEALATQEGEVERLLFKCSSP